MYLGLPDISLIRQDRVGGVGGVVFSPLDLSPLLWMSADEGLYTGGSRQFTAANSELLSIADNASLSVADIDFTVAGWVRFDTVGIPQGIVAKDDTLNGIGGECLLRLDATNNICFIIRQVTTGADVVRLIGSTVIAANTWYFFVAEHNSVANTATLWVNNVQDDTDSTTLVPFDGTNTFHIGGDSRDGFLNGCISKVFFKKAVLTTAERTYLFNLGNGRIAGELGIAGTDGVNLDDAAGGSLPSYWNGNEASGIGIDAVGANDLTDNNTVTSADGPESEIASDSVGANHGQLIGFADPETAWSSDRPTPIAALVDGSLAFDGVDDYVSVSSFINQSYSSGSYSIWFRTTVADATNRRMIDMGSGANRIALYAETTSKKATLFIVDEGVVQCDIQSDVAVNDGAWHHAVGTWETNSAKLYIDGVLQVEVSASCTASLVSTDPLRIGEYCAGTGFSWGGSLSDPRVYNVALSQSQVSQLFAGSEATGATPTARWKLDDGPQTGLVTGDLVIRKTSIDGNYIDFEQAAAEKRPKWSSTALGTTGGLVANGTNNGLVHVGTISTSTDGTFAIAFRTGASAFAVDQTLFSTADEAVANEYLQIGIDATGKCFVEVNDSGTVHRVTGDTVLSNSTSYVLAVTSNDTAWAMRVNAVAQTLSVFGANNGKWFGDLAGRDNVSIGFLKTTSESKWFEGSLGEITLYDSELTAPQITQLETYIADEAGITL